MNSQIQQNLKIAIQSKNAEKIRRIVQNLNEKIETSALADLARVGSVECVRELMPYVRQKKVNDAIRAGVQSGHFEVVQILQAFTNLEGFNKSVADACLILDKTQNSVAHTKILDYLFPLCNPQATLNIMLASHKWAQHTQPLQDKIAHTQNATLRSAVHAPGIQAQRKM